MDDCIFCKIVKGQIPAVKIYEDADVLSFLDIGPVSNGHALVIPKQHFEKLHQCPPNVMASVGSVLGKIGNAVVSAMDADGYNVLCNNGKAAGQLVGHVHFHIIPRKTGDGVFDRWSAYSYKEGQIEKFAALIKAKL